MYARFYNYVKVKNLGIVLHATFGIILDQSNVLQPDIIFIASANKEIIKEEGIIGVPDLLLEIIFSSSIKTDRFTKYQLCENKGVAKYWIIDLKNENIEVFENTDKGFKPFSFASEEDKANSKLL